MKKLLLGLIVIISNSVSGQCIEITSIFVNSCSTTMEEGENEMFTFTVGVLDLLSTDLDVTFPNHTFQGFCQNANTASKTALLNASILSSCGFILEPVGNVLPANKNVIVVTSETFSTTDNSFEGLIDTLYILYQCANNVGNVGHFSNSPPSDRTLIVSVSNSCVQVESVTYDGAIPNADGGTALFDAAGNVSYANNGCNAPVVSLNPSWSINDVCQSSGVINLNDLLSLGATSGGVWTGAGVVDSFFNPSLLLGSTNINYSLAGTSSCSSGLDSTINFNVTLPAVNEIVNIQSCDSVFFDATWFYSDTSINDTLSGMYSYSCDSTFTTNVIISSQILDSIYIESCFSYLHETVLFTADTTLYDTLYNTGGSGGSSTCSELYFSEYAEGSSNNKYLEIFNGTGSAVNLSNYTIEKYNNGSPIVSETQILAGLLADGDVFVVYNSSANAAIQAAGDLPSAVTSFNGDDAIGLSHNGTMVDLIGNIGCDPGSMWGTGALITKEATIIRNPNYIAGVLVDPINAPCGFPSLTAVNWTGLGQDDFSNIGFHISNCSGSISSGCDTLVVTAINIIENVKDTISLSSCDSLEILGHWIYSSILVNDTILGGSTNGCDSIVTFNVQINNSIATSFNTTSCNVADTGIVVQNLNTVNSCDSVHTIYTTLISCGFCFENETLSICSEESAFLGGAWQNSSGTYYDTIVSQSLLDCDTVLETVLIVNSLPNVNAGIDQSIVYGEEVTLSVSGANTYLWSTNDNTNNIIVSPFESTIYFVEGFDENDCSAFDSVKVNVELENVEILIPTAFSPNGDGVNDTFRIVNESFFEDIVIRIYNRWGDLVFNGSKNSTGWDGLYKNKPQALESYVYYIKAISRSSGEKISVSGNVSIVR